MKSNEIFLNSEGLGTAETLGEVEDFCGYQRFSKKEALQTRLLAEELLGMMKGILGDREGFEAEFWVEGTGKRCELHVTAWTRVDSDTREALLSVSSSGKNIAAKGVMGKIRQVVEGYLAGYEELDRYCTASGMMIYPHIGLDGRGMVGSMAAAQMWSLQTYIGAVEQKKETEEDAWDELEKSIVAKLADDVLVGVQNKKVEIIVKKSFEDREDSHTDL